MEITPEQKEQLVLVAQEIGAVFIVVYGSNARREAQPDSDLDIAVLTTGIPDYTLFTMAFSRISNVFRGKNVDVRFLNDADMLFTMQVVRDGVLLYGNRNAYDDFRMLTNRRYVDEGAVYFPMHRAMLREQQERLEAMIHD
ncbi:nucleotidyltransferase domain-containing protein [Candidatus Gottesmanbacteria bacterium]|nr:nucleotidyltransferase domain-containing protein [Candidatus Gottesmanbacteria bacterium]